MLTSYLVKCPNADCRWFGSLLPRQDLEAWRTASPHRSEASFQCPKCHGEWRARVVGDDVFPLPQPEPALSAR
jgi:hypothetical protein